LSSVDVQCEIIKDALETKHWYSGVQGVWDNYEYTQRFIVKVKGTVVFENSQNLAGSPIVAALVLVLIKLLPYIIIAIGIAWGIYEFLRNLTLNETSSTIHTIKYDAQGNVTSDTTETTKTQQPAGTAWTGIIALAIVGIGLLVVLPSLLGKKERRRR
jgi:YD repeat-containing protein